jgi:hypothetical protein
MSSPISQYGDSNFEEEVAHADSELWKEAGLDIGEFYALLFIYFHKKKIKTAHWNFPSYPPLLVLHHKCFCSQRLQRSQVSNLHVSDNKLWT